MTSTSPTRAGEASSATATGSTAAPMNAVMSRNGHEMSVTPRCSRAPSGSIQGRSISPDTVVGAVPDHGEEHQRRGHGGAAQAGGDPAGDEPASDHEQQAHHGRDEQGGGDHVPTRRGQRPDDDQDDDTGSEDGRVALDVARLRQRRARARRAGRLRPRRGGRRRRRPGRGHDGPRGRADDGRDPPRERPVEAQLVRQRRGRPVERRPRGATAAPTTPMPAAAMTVLRTPMPRWKGWPIDSANVATASTTSGPVMARGRLVSACLSGASPKKARSHSRVA